MTSPLKHFSVYFNLYYIKQIDSKLHTVPRAPLLCSYHILTSSVIYYWTDARQLGIRNGNREFFKYIYCKLLFVINLVSQGSWVQIPYRPEFRYCQDRFHIHILPVSHESIISPTKSSKGKRKCLIVGIAFLPYILTFWMEDLVRANGGKMSRLGLM